MLPYQTSPQSRRAARAAALLIALIAIAVLGVSMAGADDGDPGPPDAPPLVAGDGPFLGVLPMPPADGASEDDTPPDASTVRPLVYRGGSVMLSSAVYPIYWVPKGFSVSKNYTSVINGFLANVAHDSKKHTNVYGTDTQYYQQDSHGKKQYIAYSVSVGAAYTDTASFPAGGCANRGFGVCLTDSQLKLELSRVIRAQHWPSGLANAYFIFLPKDVDVCMSASSCTYSTEGFCAYHSWYGSGPTLYAVLPYAAWLGCSSGQRPNGDDADDTLNGLSHEHNEMLTDPTGQGWIDSAGYEIGDKCAWTFGSALGSNSKGKYNQVIGGTDYYLQEEWSNDGSRCLQRY